jgi:hypothetical protein
VASTLAAFALATTTAPTATSAPISQARGDGLCGAARARTTVTTFLSAFNSGQPAKLGRVIARADQGFRWYAVIADVGRRIDAAAQNRATLLDYFADRHRHSERLTLQQFTYGGYSLGKAEFTFRLVRSADDLPSPAIYEGKGAINCWGNGGISVWAMGPKA